MQFWNQRDHLLLDKRLVLPALAMLAEGVTTAAAPAMSQRELFDSVVESSLFSRLRAEGLPRPRTGRDNVLRDASGLGILQMDLSWPERKLLVLLDGREFHAATAEQVLIDEDKRNRSIAAGWCVMEFTGWEVVHRLDEVVAEIRDALDARYTTVQFVTGGPGPAGLATAAESGGVRVLCSGPLPAALAHLQGAGFAGSGLVSAGGLEMEALAVRQDPSAVVLGVDIGAWLADAGAWRRQLRLMRQLARAGVRCFRLPLERLQDPTDLRHALELMGFGNSR